MKKGEKAARSRLKELQAGIKSGKIAIELGNTAAREDKGKGCVRAWVNKGYFGVEYSLHGFGFGGFSFNIVDVKPEPNDPDVNICPTGRIYVNSERMSREFVKKVLCRLVDEADWDTDEQDNMVGPDEI